MSRSKFYRFACVLMIILTVINICIFNPLGAMVTAVGYIHFHLKLKPLE